MASRGTVGRFDDFHELSESFYILLKKNKGRRYVSSKISSSVLHVWTQYKVNVLVVRTSQLEAMIEC